LLDRDKFRASVLARDSGKCVLCGNPAQDAHHIMERRLFPDGGYYAENGASVCGECHRKCERTEVPVEKIREAAGITRAVLPPHLYDDQPYDKWGNPVMPNGQRLKGDLYDDESVQKTLAEGGAIALFLPYVKYPRTFHLPWSPGVGKDDRVLRDASCFAGKEVVATEKIDGENTTLYRDHIHARSIDSGSHPSRGWVKAFHASIAAEIPDGWRVCGENMYAVHTLKYKGLPSYFAGFSVWNSRNECLPWNETLEWFALLSIVPAHVLWRGIYDEKAIREIGEKSLDLTRQEGYVLRTTAGFRYWKFRENVAKYVRAGHVGEASHWQTRRRVERNGLATGAVAG